MAGRGASSLTLVQALVASLLAMVPVLPLAAQSTPWSAVPEPRITSIGLHPEDPRTIRVVFTMPTGSTGADSIVVVLRDMEGRELGTKTLGRARAEERVADFLLSASARCRVEVQAIRRNESDVKKALGDPFDFRLPLVLPELSIKNRGGGSLELSWPKVAEAEAYTIDLVDPRGAIKSSGRITGTSLTFVDLVPGERWTAMLQTHRGNETVVTAPYRVTVRQDPDRDWAFTRFGQSSSAEANTFRMLDQDAFRFQLSAATFDAQGNTVLKGGKLTTFHDGISFYHTRIHAATENFVLSATFTLDAMNPTPDGQEGFGLLVMDSLGGHEVSSVNHYTNSAGILATKFEETVDGTKYTSKDTLGSRFVWGITPKVLAGGDSAIAQEARNRSQAFDYRSSALVQAGKSYRMTLVKDNTGYHTRFRNPLDPEAAEIVRTLYGPEKLLALDPEWVYLGFAAARGVRVTVSDVDFRLSHPAKDPPAQPEPPVYLPLVAKVQSSEASGDAAYALAWSVNAPGTLTVTDSKKRIVARSVPVKPDTLWQARVQLETGANTYHFSFVPDPGYSPMANTRMGVWNPQTGAYGPPGGPLEQSHTVYHRTYPGPVLHVGPHGSFRGKGSRDKPLNLATALAFVQAGQTIELLDGVYHMREGVVIQRGNSGSPTRPKILRAAPGSRAILDFSEAGAGMQVWGDWWQIRGLDIRRTPGNVKGLQIAGHHNVVSQVRTYFNGDTGLQISGSGSEPPSWWPSHNRIEYCTSFDNKDPASNNADGFAAKITVGEGNVFSWCIAYGNIDDGWDLFTKIESGPIPPVVIEHSVAYRNGSLSSGQGNGDGNGFKLGGDGIAVAHVLRNSLAFENGAAGITSNSNPAIVVDQCTSMGNKGANITLYGKGTSPLDFRIKGLVSWGGGQADNVPAANQGALNYIWTGAESTNAAGQKIGRPDFLALSPGDAMRQFPPHPDDYEPSPWPELPRKADGTFDCGGLFVLRYAAGSRPGWNP